MKGSLLDLFSRIAEAGHALVSAGAGRKNLGDSCAALLSGRGEATGLALARDILGRYAALDQAGKRAFFAEAAQSFGVDEGALKSAINAWRAAGGGDPRAIHLASEPRSRELIRRLNRAPGGTRALVAMRADLLRAASEDAALQALDMDFRHLLASWFNRGFLELRRIDWSSPAAVLEKIIAYEAVHAIDGWDDLRQRVAAPDRRLYAFFHPALVDDPLIFVEVALTDAVPAAIGPILAGERAALSPGLASVAAFYSISNCQAGLQGISFGNFLIKQVVEELQGELKGLKTFATLSPLPGLRRWAVAECGRGQAGMLTAPQRTALQALEAAGAAAADGAAAEILPEVAARYLIQAKTPRRASPLPLDPVARFHLGNGARLEWINAAADRSARGLENAWGVMVNYLYDLDAIERNHEAFANTGEVIVSARVRRLLKAH
ncbi:MAG: malonyl-CoA decarboxylase [Gammaproteobacteria bacterium]|nr:malonyl-CoA decarboxylase [Gammaproteobacteria bacterium]